jgi:hypothetical protein
MTDETNKNYVVERESSRVCPILSEVDREIADRFKNGHTECALETLVTQLVAYNNFSREDMLRAAAKVVELIALKDWHAQEHDRTKAKFSTLADAAKGLSSYYSLKHRAFVGINEQNGTIRVYLHDTWGNNTLPHNWQGWPIIWSHGHGPGVAAIVEQFAPGTKNVFIE